MGKLFRETRHKIIMEPRQQTSIVLTPSLSVQTNGSVPINIYVETSTRSFVPSII